MKKDFTAEIACLTNKTNELKKSIINAIKDYMNEYGITRFVNWFFEEDDRIKDENKDEYENLFYQTDEDRINTIFDYCTETSDLAQPNTLSLNENGELQMECGLAVSEIGYLLDDTETFNENAIIRIIYPIDVLNQCLLNLQNEKFHRMNELINNN